MSILAPVVPIQLESSVPNASRHAFTDEFLLHYLPRPGLLTFPEVLHA